MEIGFGQRNGDGSCITGGVNGQICIVDNESLRKVICVPILLPVSFHLILMTKLWDMIIGLCMYKARMGQANVLDSNSDWLTTNERDIPLPVTVKSDILN